MKDEGCWGEPSSKMYCAPPALLLWLLLLSSLSLSSMSEDDEDAVCRGCVDDITTEQMELWNQLMQWR